jgi:inward rectifier potassium channel
MAFLKKINDKAKAQDNTGFGSNAQNYGGRFVSKNGNANVKKTGISFLESISWYHTMLTIPRWKFMFIVVLFYFVVNCFFAALYFIIGVEHLNGITAINKMEQFGQAFFFSVQTFTTVGYGHISPSGFMASFISSVEALFGLLSFAIATGLFYGRFSKPKAHIMFSENALIAPFQGGKALMIRLCPFKNTTLTDAEARLTLGLHIEEEGKMVNKFYQLDLELEKINALTLSWTLVHPISEKSPLYQFTEDDFKSLNGEIIVFVKSFDDLFSSNVVKRASYTFNEIVYGAKFLPMFTRNNEDTKTILHIDKLNLFEKIIL